MNQVPRVLYVITDSGIGGAEKKLLDILQHLDRLLAGELFMHKQEYVLSQSRRAGNRRLWASLRRSPAFDFTTDDAMWNSGVIAIPSVDRPLLDQSIALYDRLAEAGLRHFPLQEVSGHYHDTYGQALANVYASLELGVATFDASVGGLGGCPYAKGATGNVATEDVLWMLNGLGIETGVDLDALVDAAAYISGALGRPVASRVGRAVLAKRSA